MFVVSAPEMEVCNKLRSKIKSDFYPVLVAILFTGSYFFLSVIASGAKQSEPCFLYCHTGEGRYPV